LIRQIDAKLQRRCDAPSYLMRACGGECRDCSVLVDISSRKGSRALASRQQQRALPSGCLLRSKLEGGEEGPLMAERGPMTHVRPSAIVGHPIFKTAMRRS